MIVLQGCVGFCCTMKISHNWEFWQNMVHWRREQQTTSDSCLENTMNSMKRQKDTTLKDELPRSVGAQNATGDQWRNNSRKNEEMEPSKNNTQLWMWLVMEAKSNAVKSNITWEPGMLSSVQFSRSVVSNSLRPMNHNMPGLPVHHQLPEFTQTHVHQVSDAIQPSHPLLSPSLPAPNPSRHQSLFQWVNSSHEVAKVLEFQL